MSGAVFEAGIQAQLKDEARHRKAIARGLVLLRSLGKARIEFLLEAALLYPRDLSGEEKRLVDFRKRNASSASRTAYDSWIDALHAWRTGDPHQAAEHLEKIPDTNFNDGKLTFEKAAALKSAVFWQSGRRDEAPAETSRVPGASRPDY